MRCSLNSEKHTEWFGKSATPRLTAQFIVLKVIVLKVVVLKAIVLKLLSFFRDSCSLYLGRLLGEVREKSRYWCGQSQCSRCAWVDPVKVIFRDLPNWVRQMYPHRLDMQPKVREDMY